MKKKRLIILVIVAAAVIIGAVTIGRQRFGSTADTVRTTVVERRDVVQDISFTGQLKAEQEAQLGFEFPGMVKSVPVKVGSVVEAGQLLMQLDARSAQLEQAKALADKASAQDQLYIAWQQAAKDWQNIKATNASTLEENRQAVRNAKAELDQSEAVWQQKVRESGEESSIAKTAYSTFLTTQSAYKSTQDALTTAQATAEKNESVSRGAADTAQAKYTASTQAASKVSGLSSLAATQALASVKLAKSSMTAPFAGMVTAINVEVGEIITAGTSLLTLQTADKLKVTAAVPETDAANLTVGQPATITFDAFPSDEEWSAEVMAIAPAAIVLDGIPTYEVTLQLTALSEKFKPGLTTNIVVHAARRSNVLAIPSRAIINKDDQKIVRVQVNPETAVEQTIKTGLTGSDGWVEVRQGLSGSEKIVIGQPES